MAVTRAATSDIVDGAKYISFLAGNPAFVAPAFESIATATGTGASTTITFSDIPQTYTALQIRMTGKVSSTGTGVASLLLTFNGSATGYAQHALTASTSVAATGTASTTSITVPSCATTSGPTSTNGVSIIDIHDYASTARNKTVRAFSGADLNSSTVGAVSLSSGLWADTAAVTSITLTGFGAGTPNWSAASTFALYGIKAGA